MTRGEKPERRIVVSRPFVVRTRHYGIRPIFGGLVEHEKPICLRTPENVVRTRHYGMRPIFGGLVEHEKPICLRTPENVVRTRHYLCICRMAGLLV